MNSKTCEYIYATHFNSRPLHNRWIITCWVFTFTAISKGCFRDTGRRAVATLEGRSRLLKGSYRRRRYAIQKCAMAAKRRGWGVFAVQHGGWCASAKYAYRTYGKYGRSNRCRHGKGGPWANDVYFLKGKFVKKVTESVNICTTSQNLRMDFYRGTTSWFWNFI